MDGCHAVYGKAVMDVNVRHMDSVLLINDLNLRILVKELYHAV